MSRALAWTVLGGALAVLLAAAITVGVVVHADAPTVQVPDVPQLDDLFRSSGGSSF